jgi:transposase
LGVALIVAYLITWDDHRVEFNFLRPDPDQMYLMPPDPRDWLPAGHLAWRVRDAVDGMDLSGFLAAYRRDGQGAAAFHPATMVAVLLYCYCKGIRSSRAIEMASHDDVGVRVLLGNRHPDHATVARFVERHRKQMRPLFVQVLVQCARQGLVTVDVVAIDGTKVKANASMGATVNAEQLDLGIAELEALLADEVDEWFAQTQRAEAAAEGPRGGGDDSGSGGTAGAGRSVKRAANTLARRRAAKARLAAEEQARLQQAVADKHDDVGRKARRLARAQRVHDEAVARQQAKVDAYWRRGGYSGPQDTPVYGGGPMPIPPDQHAHVRSAAQRLQRAKQRHAEAMNARPTPAGKAPTVNTTDPDSRIMRGKDKAFRQAHNLQIAVNCNQVILSVASHDNATDVAALHPQLGNARANLNAAGITTPIGVVLADAGYASAENFTSSCEATLYVAVTNDARQTGRRTDPVPKNLKSWHDMQQRLATEPGKALYKRRSQIVEPVFGQLFQRLGRALNYRTHTDAEFHLWAASHNLLKLFRRPQPA